jgi:hypothetical protein
VDHPRREPSDRHDRPLTAAERRPEEGAGPIRVGVDTALTCRCAQSCAFSGFFESFFPRTANDLNQFFRRIVGFAFTFFKKHRIVIDSDYVRVGCAPRFRRSGAVSDDRRTHKRPVMPNFAKVSHGTSVDPTPSIPGRKLLETGGSYHHKAWSIRGLRSSDLGSAIHESPRSGSPLGRARWPKDLPKECHFAPLVRDSRFPARRASVLSPEQRRF